MTELTDKQIADEFDLMMRPRVLPDFVVFARAVLAKWGQPAGETEEVENLRKALVYVAFALHDTPQYMLAQGITLIDGDTVRVSRDGWTVEASSNPLRQPEPQPSPAAQGEVLESEYRRGYRHGYEQRDAEVRGALA